MRFHLLNLLVNLIIKLNVNSSWYCAHFLPEAGYRRPYPYFPVKPTSTFHVPITLKGIPKLPIKSCWSLCWLLNATLHMFLITKSDFWRPKLGSKKSSNSSLNHYTWAESWKLKYKAPENSLHYFHCFLLQSGIHAHFTANRPPLLRLWAARGRDYLCLPSTGATTPFIQISNNNNITFQFMVWLVKTLSGASR